MAEPTFGDTRLPARFWAKVAIDGDCWMWAAATAAGYGRFGVGGRSLLAHRVAYVALIGPIPDGRVLDHHLECGRTECVNPLHVHPVEQRENVLRSQTNPLARNARAETCKRGHPLTLKRDGHRYCKVCQRERMASVYRADPVGGARRRRETRAKSGR